MSRALATRLTSVVNETDVRGEAMRALIKQYLNIDVYYPFQPIGDNPKARFPAVYVQPLNQMPDLATTGKYHLRLAYAIFWYVFDNNAQDATILSTDIMENLIKLFSNNALNDLALSAPPSHNFRAYEPFWTDSNWSARLRVRPPYKNAVQGHDEEYMVFGGGVLEIESWVIK